MSAECFRCFMKILYNVEIDTNLKYTCCLCADQIKYEPSKYFDPDEW